MSTAPPSAPELTTAGLQVTSETGRLRDVVVHTPGREMELVQPALRLELLFDDILYVEEAQREHRLLCRFFEKAVGENGRVRQISDLLRDVFQIEDARMAFIQQLAVAERESNLQAFEDELKQLSPSELHRFALTGESPLSLHANPLPNMLFTRDVAAVVGGHVVLSHAATAARARESILVSVIFRFHPAFASLRNRIITLPQGVTFEGGDLLMPDERFVVVGQSERTSFGGVMALTQALFSQTDIEHLVMVSLPHKRACMHLDTVFTFTAPDECVVYPQIIDRTHLGNVVQYSRGDEPGSFTTRVRMNLKVVLEELLDRRLTFIPCGGKDPFSQEREQWTDGANLFAVAPGVVVGYARNSRTFEALAERGYRVVELQSYLDDLGDEPFQPSEKLALELEGDELSRGRGGARCMTLPLART